MTGILGLYFVIADGGRARFVRPDPENALHTVDVVDLPALRKRDPGHFDGAGPPPPFLHQLAARIDEDFAVDLFSHLVLVAPPRLLRELSALIDASTTASMFGSLAKDLMAVPDLELWPHLLPWLQPPQTTWTATVPMKGG